MEYKTEILDFLFKNIKLPREIYIKIKTEFSNGIKSFEYLSNKKNLSYEIKNQYLVLTIFEIAIIYKNILAPMMSLSKFKYEINLGRDKISKDDIQKFEDIKISFNLILSNYDISLEDLNYSDFAKFMYRINRI